MALGILEQKSLLEAGFRAVKKTTASRKVTPLPSDFNSKFTAVRSRHLKYHPIQEKTKVEPARSSSRLAGALPEYKGLADDCAECHEGVYSKRVFR